MKKATLLFCIEDDKVLLGMKKQGFGAGKWNGYGGKVHDGEDPRTAAVRELEEESGLIALEADLEQVARVRFYFDKKPAFECFVYTTLTWQGEPVETDEMRPQWHAVRDLPFDEMWAADARWLPLILNRETIEAEVNFNSDGTAVQEFSYRPAEFK